MSQVSDVVLANQGFASFRTELNNILGALNIGMQAIHFNSHDEPMHDHCPIVQNLDEINLIL